MIRKHPYESTFKDVGNLRMRVTLFKAGVVGHEKVVLGLLRLCSYGTFQCLNDRTFDITLPAPLLQLFRNTQFFGLNTL